MASSARHQHEAMVSIELPHEAVPASPLKPLDEASFGALIGELREGGVVPFDR